MPEFGQSRTHLHWSLPILKSELQLLALILLMTTINHNMNLGLPNDAANCLRIVLNHELQVEAKLLVSSSHAHSESEITDRG